MLKPNDHQLKRIKDTYSKQRNNDGSVIRLSKELQVRRWEITEVARANGWAKAKADMGWDKGALKILENNAHKMPDAIRGRLKMGGYVKSVSAIVKKRTEMRYLKNLNGMTLSLVSEIIGIDTRTIKNHIDKGYLKARKRKSGKTERQGGEAYYILPQNIRKWIIEHVGKISLKYANKYVLVDLLTTVKDY